MFKKENFDYINANEESIQALKNACRVFTKENFNSIKDIDLKELLINNKCTHAIIINDFDTIIENSVLKNELPKIKKMKMKFEQVNTQFLRENEIVESDELVETNNRQIFNRALYMNLKRRGFNPTPQNTNLYLENEEVEGYKEVKSYFLNICLSYSYNHDFEAIASKLKKALSSKKDSFTTYRTILTMNGYGKEVALVFPNLTFNNERLTKELYKLFLPFNSLVAMELSMLFTNISQNRGWYVSEYKNCVSLQNL